MIRAGKTQNHQIIRGDSHFNRFTNLIGSVVNGITTGTVGLITSPIQAEQILSTELADAVLLGRKFLSDPYWPLNAAAELGVDLPWPDQYKRAKPSKQEPIPKH